jgi:hypothetical protein
MIASRKRNPVVSVATSSAPPIGFAENKSSSAVEIKACASAAVKLAVEYIHASYVTGVGIVIADDV